MTEARARTCLIISSLFIGWLCCEATLRLYDMARGRSMNARAFWYWLYEQDPYLGWRGRPGARARTDLDDIHHNSAGFRDDRDLAEVSRLAAGHRLIICVGESSTYGISAGSNDRTYPARLEQELRALSGGDRWRVFNAGMPGYTSHEVMELIHLQLLKLHPEIIMEMNLDNDHDFMGTYLDDVTDYNHLPIRLAQLSKSPVRELLMRSSVYALIASGLRTQLGDDLGGRVDRPPYERVTPRGIKFYRDNLAATALIAARSGVTLMLVDQPIDYTGLSSADVESHETLRGALRELAASEKVPLLEAHARFDWSGLKIHQKVHLSAEGYDRLAKLLAPQILSQAP
jgi:hypothetical protein